MKNILLQFEDREFFRLKKLKGDVEGKAQRIVTWEEFIIMLKENALKGGLRVVLND